MSYCMKCGNELSEEAFFCPNCGTKVDNTTKVVNKVETRETNSTNKRALMVLSTNKKEGMLKSIACYLVFHEGKIIFAHLNKEKQKAEMKELQKVIKAEGKGFFKGSAEMMKYWSNYGNKYYEMNIVDILNENSMNFELNKSQISKFVFRAVRRSTSDTKDTPGEIVIRTAENKLKFVHNYMDTNKKIKGILESLNLNKFDYRSSGYAFSINIGGNKDGFI